MPQISGFEVLKKLKKDGYAHYKQQPIIAMTGRKDLEETEYWDAGFSAVLLKPFAKNSFLKVLSHLFPQSIQDENESIQPSAQHASSSLFNLEVINSFLGDNKAALYEVLTTFISDVRTNLDHLNEAIEKLNRKGINATAHKMLPMFRQLKANDIVPILEKLEVLNESEMDKQELKRTSQDLKNKTTVLLLAITSYMSKDLNYNG
jgi:CheY-like chemotaxis protein